MLKYRFLRILIILILLSVSTTSGAQDLDTLIIHSTSDFTPSGDGSAPEWNQASWLTIPQREDGGFRADTKLQALYSDSGLYFLFFCEDSILNASMTSDFMNLWTEDVVEVFLWPEEDFPVYFEYELSPLNYELPILIPNNNGNFLGWRPWHYEGDRKTKHQTSIEGGEKKTGASIKAWIAEFYIPYALLEPLGNIPPKKGTTWRGNFYRVDYDGPESSTWQWQEATNTFHEYDIFGVLLFQ